MPNLNRVTIMGRLTRDPETRYLPSNTAVCAFGIAINRRWTDTKSGELKEETTFVDCEAFGKVAEMIGQHFHKGSNIYLEGRLKLDEWEDKTAGGKRSKMKVIAESFQFLDPRAQQDDATRAAATPPAQRTTMNAARAAMGKAPAATQAHQPVGDDQIPF